MGQPEQAHPHEDFPFFLFRIMPAIMATTIAASTAQIIIVAKFSDIQLNITLP